METIAADLARAKERLKHTEEIKKKRLLLKQQVSITAILLQPSIFSVKMFYYSQRQSKN